MSIDLLAADWPAPAGIVAGSTTRSGGVSTGTCASLNLGDHVGDDPEHVAENRRRLVHAAGMPSEPLWLAQVHGAEVVDAATATFDAGPPQADACISADGRAVLGVLTADCLPVLLCSTRGAPIAALHCGWRSLSGGIVANTVERLREDPQELLAWFGPAISQPAFEVGDDVRDLFLAGIDDAAACFRANDNGRWQADLYGLARLTLEAAGVTQIYGGGLCTYADRERFYSYRRDGQTGRLATWIFRA